MNTSETFTVDSSNFTSIKLDCINLGQVSASATVIGANYSSNLSLSNSLFNKIYKRPIVISDIGA